MDDLNSIIETSGNYRYVLQHCIVGNCAKKKKKRFEIVESKPRAVGNKGIEG